jgi:hypothetical protein
MPHKKKKLEEKGRHLHDFGIEVSILQYIGYTKL